MTDELKSCPFCGEPAKIIESHRYDASVDPTPPHWKVSCATIGCNGAAINIWRQSPEDAIAAWNTRHESDELPEWVKDAIEDMIQRIFDIMSTNPQGYVKNCELLSKVHVLERVHSLRKPEENK